jgi:hypothetical protein
MKEDRIDVQIAYGYTYPLDLPAAKGLSHITTPVRPKTASFHVVLAGYDFTRTTARHHKAFILPASRP